MSDKKNEYERPSIEVLIMSKGLNLLANLSLEGDFEEIDFENY